MAKMTYAKLMKQGKQVVSLPILSDEATGQWTPYAIAISLKPGGRKTCVEIHYVSHEHDATCPMNDIFGNQLDPRIEFAKAYSFEIVRQKETV